MTIFYQCFFFFNDTATTEIYTLSLHDALPTFARQQELGLLPVGTELSPRPEWVPAWDSLPRDEQRVAARFQECFAAFLSHADHHLGRVLDFLGELGRRHDTLAF